MKPFSSAVSVGTALQTLPGVKWSGGGPHRSAWVERGDGDSAHREPLSGRGRRSCRTYWAGGESRSGKGSGEWAGESAASEVGRMTIERVRLEAGVSSALGRVGGRAERRLAFDAHLARLATRFHAHRKLSN